MIELQDGSDVHVLGNDGTVFIAQGEESRTHDVIMLNSEGAAHVHERLGEILQNEGSQED